jgi:hypothetical protein
VAGITFADEDILAFDTTTGSWSLYFDGSDVGITQDINAFHLEDDGTLLLSFGSNFTLAGFGAVTWGDIVRFTPTSLGETTAGSFAWVLDGSDVGLASNANIDAIGRLPDGRLLISTSGNVSVPDANGNPISASGHDLLVFNATSLGEESAGSWEFYFDGSDVGISGTATNLWDVWVDPATGNLYLVNKYTFTVTGNNSLSGDGDDIFVCQPTSLGETTACTFYPFWDGDSQGFNFAIDSMSIGTGTAPAPTATPSGGTPTDTPTDTPTATPVGATPTPTPTSSGSTTIYIGSENNSTVGGVSFDDDDILAFDSATGSWALYLDGSDIGIISDIDAFHVEDDGSLLLSFYAAGTLPDVGAVEPQDIVRFTPTSLGETTAGSFSWVLDGSDVELDDISENIDAIARTADGRLVVSTLTSFAFTGLSGDDSDLIVFNATSLGETTAGSWEFYFDGSDVGLTLSGEDLSEVWIDSATGNLYLNTYLHFSANSVNSLSGDSDNIFICVPGSLGETTSCTFYPFWDGDSHGFNQYADSLSIGGVLPPVNASAALDERRLSSEEQLAADQSERIFLPLIIEQP